MRIALQNIFRFIILVLIQVYVLDNIQFLGYISPMIYVLFLLSLPVRLHSAIVMLIAFGLGLTIDMFNNTMGMHAFASVLIAFIRPAAIRVFTDFDQIYNPTPSFRTFGVRSYTKYVVILVLVHHTVLFFIESFSFLNFSQLIPKILLSSLVTILLILGIQSLERK
ncbi:MAG: rod shape-determining protein MreD [Paludibacteraceae bacterium]